MGITFTDGRPATVCRGRYQTRISRIAEITGSRTIDVDRQGKIFSRKIWDGKLFNADGVTVDTSATWTDPDGNFFSSLHQEGVPSPFDLSKVISQEPEPEAAPAPEASSAAEPEPDEISDTEMVSVVDANAIIDRVVAERDHARKECDAMGWDNSRLTAERDEAREQVKKLLAAPVTV